MYSRIIYIYILYGIIATSTSTTTTTTTVGAFSIMIDIFPFFESPLVYRPSFLPWAPVRHGNQHYGSII